MNTKIDQISERNRKVELDKAWETSWARRVVIALITYGFAALFLYMIKVPDFWLAALVPVAGFIFSTLTLEPLKKIWCQSKT